MLMPVERDRMMFTAVHQAESTTIISFMSSVPTELAGSTHTIMTQHMHPMCVSKEMDLS